MQNLRKKVEEYFAQFGIPKKAFKHFEFLERGSSIWLVSKDLKKVEGFNIQTFGLRILHTTKWGLKPTSFALQFFAPYIKKRICSVNERELLDLIKGKPLEKSMEAGYVALKFRGKIIGCALSDGKMIRSQLPKLLMQIFTELLETTDKI